MGPLKLFFEQSLLSGNTLAVSLLHIKCEFCFWTWLWRKNVATIWFFSLFYFYYLAWKESELRDSVLTCEVSHVIGTVVRFGCIVPLNVAQFLWGRGGFLQATPPFSLLRIYRLRCFIAGSVVDGLSGADRSRSHPTGVRGCVGRGAVSGDGRKEGRKSARLDGVKRWWVNETRNEIWKKKKKGFIFLPNTTGFLSWARPTVVRFHFSSFFPLCQDKNFWSS